MIQVRLYPCVDFLHPYKAAGDLFIIGYLLIFKRLSSPWGNWWLIVFSGMTRGKEMIRVILKYRTGKISQIKNDPSGRIWLVDSELNESYFKPGSAFSVNIDENAHLITIEPKGSRKVCHRDGKSVIDIKNLRVKHALENCDYITIAIYHNRIVIKGRQKTATKLMEMNFGSGRGASSDVDGTCVTETGSTRWRAPACAGDLARRGRVREASRPARRRWTASAAVGSGAGGSAPDGWPPPCFRRATRRGPPPAPIADLRTGRRATPATCRRASRGARLGRVGRAPSGAVGTGRVGEPVRPAAGS